MPASMRRPAQGIGSSTASDWESCPSGSGQILYLDGTSYVGRQILSLDSQKIIFHGVLSSPATKSSMASKQITLNPCPGRSPIARARSGYACFDPIAPQTQCSTGAPFAPRRGGASATTRLQGEGRESGWAGQPWRINRIRPEIGGI